MKPTSSPQDEELIRLLKRLGTLTVEYPPELLEARRADFTAQIEKRIADRAQDMAAPSEDKVLELLEGLRPPQAAYPPELLAARRTAFLAQIEQRNGAGAWEGSPEHNRMIEVLRAVRSAEAKYPADLLAARRESFVARIRQHNAGNGQAAFVPAPERGMISLLGRLRSIEIEYPLRLWTARRSAFIAQIREGKTSVLDALRAALRGLVMGIDSRSPAPATGFGRISMVVATLLVVAFVGSWAAGRRQPQLSALETQPIQPAAAQPSLVAAITSTQEVARLICKPGYLPPLCLTQKFDKSLDLTSPGNGSARPAVAKDTVPGYSRIHRPAYVNDGLYGPGASWISNSAYSWIKIDLGEARTVNTVTFGRDRLGQFNDGDPGQFLIAVALVDDVYADGNSSNDFMEYTQVYNSAEAGFDGMVSGSETVTANFPPVQARFIKITFQNAGTAVDEIEVFMLQPAGVSSAATHRPRNTAVPPSFTPIPTNTLVPSRTPTLLPTNTLVPSRTPTLVPTDTPFPSDTPTVRPTSTPEPTSTPVPPTDTPVPPTATPLPPNTQPPPSTSTSAPPTFTPEVVGFSSRTPEAMAP